MDFSDFVFCFVWFGVFFVDFFVVFVGLFWIGGGFCLFVVFLIYI